ncbi:hypothetical protein G6F37_009734 [Rhizopus arrhizus]|nr:hypothetical protein G6F38_007955 [Rhizopus arrhizus]KAG1154129.1 hypothetical protein G6F37_009734 [Rhizopus arrhizus]
MVLSNIHHLDTEGVPRDSPNSTPTVLFSTSATEISTPTSGFRDAVQGTLPTHAPRVFKPSSSRHANSNNRPATSATSTPTYISIFTDALSPATPLSYATGSSDCSVTYTVPANLRHLDVPLLNKLRQQFPYGVGYAIQHKEQGHSLSIEIALNSNETCNKAIAEPIVIDEVPFPATRTFSTTLTRFNFSGVPMESPVETRDTILQLFSRYGTVIDIVLHLDDISSQWFRGNGHVLVDLQDTSNDCSPQYKLDYNDKTSILVTWSRMPKHCRYCKAMGHTRDSCPERPRENRTCFTCGVRGHLSIDCTRAPPSELAHSKRSRQVAPESRISSRNIVTPTSILQRETTSIAAPIDQPTPSSTPSTAIPDSTINSSKFSPSNSVDTNTSTLPDNANLPVLSATEDHDMDINGNISTTSSHSDLHPPTSAVETNAVLNTINSQQPSPAPAAPVRRSTRANFGKPGVRLGDE